ncbi:hypothetical protein RND81_11G085100 [Saponaria officinalis]|uniref:Uncharacterized protein n=1 Tax=Saponaria officinalis TaxID=3572 RepID=A0AAW1HL57_SAPOF
MILFGSYMSWIYLRFFQTKPETSFKGDPSDEFSFNSFFFQKLPVVNPLSSIFHRLFCGRSSTSDDGNGYVGGGIPLPGSDPIEASRRRWLDQVESGHDEKQRA